MWSRGMLLVIFLGGCATAPPPGTPMAIDGLRLVVPPSWDARLDPAGGEGSRHLLGWVASQPLDEGCEPASCSSPVTAIDDEGVVVWWFTYNCLPNCELPDDGRTMIGGREAAREVAQGTCGIDAVQRELITVRVTPQRTDVLVACSGAAAAVGLRQLEALVASIAWTVP